MGWWKTFVEAIEPMAWGPMYFYQKKLRAEMSLIRCSACMNYKKECAEQRAIRMLINSLAYPPDDCDKYNAVDLSYIGKMGTL